MAAWIFQLRPEHVLTLWQIAQRRLRRRGLPAGTTDQQQRLVIAMNAVAFAAFCVNQLDVESAEVRASLDQANALGVSTGTQHRLYEIGRAARFH